MLHILHYIHCKDLNVYIQHKTLNRPSSYSKDIDLQDIINRKKTAAI